MSANFCDSCGKALLTSTNFCTYCGTKIENLVPDATVASLNTKTISSSYIAPTIESNGSKSGYGIGVVLIMIILSIFGFLLLQLLKGGRLPL